MAAALAGRSRSLGSASRPKSCRRSSTAAAACRSCAPTPTRGCTCRTCGWRTAWPSYARRSTHASRWAAPSTHWAASYSPTPSCATTVPSTAAGCIRRATSRCTTRASSATWPTSAEARSTLRRAARCTSRTRASTTTTTGATGAPPRPISPTATAPDRPATHPAPSVSSASRRGCPRWTCCQKRCRPRTASGSTSRTMASWGRQGRRRP
mmetsp:Transcript_38839/g.93004  ORF Transcript_38839/g.93004 Transcript_38839/m.93004 type:complete len:210 (+) Transcript_38839:568-1197(+)